MQLTRKGKFLPCKAGQLRSKEYPQTWYQVRVVRRQNKRPHAAQHYWNCWTSWQGDLCIGTATTTGHITNSPAWRSRPQDHYPNDKFLPQAKVYSILPILPMWLKGGGKGKKKRWQCLHLVNILPIACYLRGMEDHKETQLLSTFVHF